MIDEMLEERGIEVGVADGLLLVVVDHLGQVHPHVLRLGLMTEGRLEAAIMPIYNEIVKHRVRLAQEIVTNAKLAVGS